MNDTRKKEIEGIIERLDADEQNLRQIRMADVMCNDQTAPASVCVRAAADLVKGAIESLKQSLA